MCALNGISKIGLKCQKHILERKPLEPPYIFEAVECKKMCVIK
jgi:hypothetical protein